MDITQYFDLDLTTLLIATTVLGLVVGSFLNVVIYRLPLMMQRENYNYCAELFACADKQVEEQAKQPLYFNLAYPASHCPACKHTLSVWENIPIVSYWRQKGRCIQCKTKISVRYPLVEFSSACLSLVTAWQIGADAALLPALCLTWALLALSLIDFDHQLLPDDITLPFIWIGVICSFFALYTDLHSSVIGVMVGYLSLWSLYWAFKLLTGKEGMGYGDFKLLAMLGAWLGWQSLPLILLLSSVAGTLIGIGLILIKKHDRNIPIPFGPYLAIAGWVALLWGPALNQAYYSISF